jgi:hypothetical protein
VFPTPAGRGPDRQSEDQTSVLNSLPGKPSTSCVQVGAHTDLRVGNVAAGNFVNARKSFTSQFGKTEVPYVFLYLIPRHAASLHKATVTIDPVGQAATATKTITSTDVEDAEQWQYFALNVPVPNPGAYRLTMKSGTDTGCFEVTFSK